MTNQKVKIGHLSAIITILIWGTTFVSTKVLLKDFTPIEILVFRFVIGYFALLSIYPHRIKTISLKQELHFAAAGLFGVTLYFLLENISLTYTLATNVGVIVSISPFFTAILAYLLLNNEKLTTYFFIGLIVSMTGVILIGFNGNYVLRLSPLGDLLAILAAVTWAVYSVIMKKISQFEYNIIGCTRKVFFYGLIFMIPAIFMFGFKFKLHRFTNLLNVANILYLGVGASALCFATWNWSVKVLGAIKTSVYIYIVPIVTAGASAAILHERITVIICIGIIFTLSGLFISDGKQIIRLRRKINDNRARYKMRYSDK